MHPFAACAVVPCGLACHKRSPAHGALEAHDTHCLLVPVGSVRKLGHVEVIAAPNLACQWAVGGQSGGSQWVVGGQSLECNIRTRDGRHQEPTMDSSVGCGEC
jgi:hypothetical protein